MGEDFILTYQIQWKNQSKCFWILICYVIIPLACYTYFLYIGEDLWKFLAVFFLAISIPLLILYLQYFFNDIQLTISVNHSKRTVTFKRKKKDIQVGYDEIENIIKHKGQFNPKNNIKVLPMAHYHHTEILLKNGESLFFTDFITKNLALKGVPLKEKIHFMNLILKE